MIVEMSRIVGSLPAMEPDRECTEVKHPASHVGTLGQPDALPEEYPRGLEFSQEGWTRTSALRHVAIRRTLAGALRLVILP